ncbi:MAG: capsular exopolysaccharide synthesis family protein [Zhongshania aliphaticivorans]|jgi:capsular exopolysaccharide synthesis family protein
MKKEDVRDTTDLSRENNGNRHYGYGYGENDYALLGPQRSFKDYLLIFRERIWYLVVALFIILFGSILYTVTKTKVYTAVAKIQLLRDDPSPLQPMTDLDSNKILGAEDFNTQIDILNSVAIIRRVEGRLKADELEEFMAPYKDKAMAGIAVTSVDVLGKNRKILPQRMGLTVGISFMHPDPIIAARIANLFAEEFSDYNQMLNIDSSIRAVRALKERVEQQRDRVGELELQIAEYREQNDAISLNEDENTMRADLLQLREIKLKEKNRHDNFTVRWEQIETYREKGMNLWELQFIANEERVVSLLDQISQIKIKIASFSKRYREQHPVMIAQLNALQESESELATAVTDAASELYAAYVEAKSNYELAGKRLVESETELFKLSKIRIEYNSLLRDRTVEQGFLQALTARMIEESAQVNFKKTNVRVIDEAFPPIRHSSPNTLLNIAAGLFGGLAAGTGLIFLVAFFDDRVKSTFDIEETIGLTLVGVISKIKNLDDSGKAQMVASNIDRSVTEAFRSIYSTLKLNDKSKDAKVILTTSTIPGEGKSFVSSNLALAFASHGEKTLLLDGDLRLPSVARSLQVEKDIGILPFIKGDIGLDDAIAKEVYPNFDILSTGGKSKNPTQILNSPKFREMLSELRERYDRIVIDSPPLAAVSDALNLLPVADGVLYVVKFNTVSHRVITKNLRNIKDSTKPLFGAVLNDISRSLSYQYSGYSGDEYGDYYTDQDDSFKRRS